MREKTINLVLAIVTGRVWKNAPNTTIQVWDCEPWMEFFRTNFIPTLFPSEKRVVNQSNGFLPPSAKKFIKNRLATTNNK